MKYGKIVLIFVAMTLSFLVACAPREVPTQPLAGSTPTEVREREQTTAKGKWEEKWEKTLAAARKEGRVIVYASSPAPALKEAVGLFKEKYGLDLEIVTGRGSELRGKLLQEHVRGLFMADILIAGLNTIFGAIKPAKVVDPIEPALILPEVTDPRAWYEGELPWADDEKLVIRSYAYPTHMIGINTGLVKSGEITSYYDLLDPKWHGKIVINDPSVTGTAFNGFSTLLLNKVVDANFFRELVQNQKTLLRDQRLQIDWLARGKYAIALWPRSVHVAEYQKAGTPVTEISVKEGTYVSSNGGNIVLIKNAPHLNAAKIFINWVLSKEGQSIMQNGLKQQSARADISIKELDTIAVRNPQMKYLVSANESEKWILEGQDNYLKLAKELFEPLLK